MKYGKLSRKFTVLVLAAILASVFVLVGCAGEGSSDGEGTTDGSGGETYQYRMATPFADGTFIHEITLRYMEKLEEYSDGRIKTELFSNSSLVPIDQQYSALFDGRIEGCMSNAAALLSMDPRYGIFHMPYLFGRVDTFDPANDVFKTLDDQRTFILDAVFKEEVLGKAMEAKGLKTWWVWVDGPRYVTTMKKPVATISDIKGLKLRMPGGEWYEKAGKAFGYSPVSIPAAEMSTALMQGTVDGALLVPLYTLESKTPCKYYTLLAQAYDTFLTFDISLDWYNTLPADLKEAVDRAGADMEEWTYKELKIRLKDTFEQLSEMGVEIVPISEETDAEAFEIAKGVWTQFENAVEGSDILLNAATKIVYNEEFF